MIQNPFYINYVIDENFAKTLLDFINKVYVVDAVSDEERHYIRTIATYLCEFQCGKRDAVFIDNRLINDKTFALRGKMFFSNITSDNEKELTILSYIKNAFDTLLNYQIETVDKKSSEYQYLKNNGLV